MEITPLFYQGEQLKTKKKQLAYLNSIRKGMKLNSLP